MTIVAVFVGMPRSQAVGNTVVFTGGAKTGVESALLRFDNFEGDGQADRRHHGGRDRAACVYIAEHYSWWKQAHGLDLGYGAFCETSRWKARGNRRSSSGTCTVQERRSCR